MGISWEGLFWSCTEETSSLGHDARPTAPSKRSGRGGCLSAIIERIFGGGKSGQEIIDTNWCWQLWNNNHTSTSQNTPYDFYLTIEQTVLICIMSSSRLLVVHRYILQGSFRCRIYGSNVTDPPLTSSTGLSFHPTIRQSTPIG